MESTDSSTCSQYPNLPPGFRFHPTDEELVVHYLKKKASAIPLPISIIAEVDLYKFDPWELPSKAIFGDQEWYFFSPRDRKYPNGMRPNRAATSGYWKATGTDKPILSSTGDQKVGVKKALVFYGGKPPKGVKTSWIMHEYRLVDNASMKSPVPGLSSKKGSLRLDEWVLCRVYKKNNASSRSATERDTDQDNYFEIINNNQDGSRLRQTCSSISKLDSSSSSLNSGVSSMVLNPGKRPFPATTHYWNLDSTDQKRFHSDDQDINGMIDGNGSFISLLNPGHQGININGGGGFHQNTVLGSLCDSTFPYQLSSLNWHP